nr:MAG TPA: hypothetical protein [Crassvirales sp.]
MVILWLSRLTIVNQYLILSGTMVNYSIKLMIKV